ncbi:SdpA family antimicrobial peptide system protein [Leifsonia sp. NPDC056665]|uniref:SdpA family antimicrobial peptide system protein n=1 Tax=Leifsonia sp. NPDC056665 TaxID=3345901 RepID=UPI0036A87D80
MKENSRARETLASRASGLMLVSMIALSAFLSANSTVLFPRQQGEGDVLRRYVLPVFPQSWPFFTKPPDDSEYAAYSVSGNRISAATDFPNSLPSNAFGFSRSQRAQGPEMANLAMEIEPGLWTVCLSTPGDCVQAADEKEPVRMRNHSTFATLCGTHMLAETEPVPWSFRDEYEGWRTDLRVVKVELTCD